MKRAICFVTLVLLSMTTSARANGADITVCNSTDTKIRVALAQLYTVDLREAWRESGWWGVDPQDCRYIESVAPGSWLALAFSVGRGDDFRPFIYRPVEQYNRSGQTPPSFSTMCTTDALTPFSRSNLSVSEIGRCANGADQIVPVSVKMYADIFTNVRTQIIIDRIPETDANDGLWEGFVEDCLNTELYGERERYTCACLSAYLEQRFSPEELTYDFPDYFTDLAVAPNRRMSNAYVCTNEQFADEFASSVDRRLVALGYEAWKPPEDQTFQLDTLQIEGEYYCPRWKMGIEIRGTTGFATTESFPRYRNGRVDYYIVNPGDEVVNLEFDESTGTFSAKHVGNGGNWSVTDDVTYDEGGLNLRCFERLQ